MRARASVAALAASLALLTGCGDGGDEPGADPTPIIPSSSPAEPTPSESEAAEEEPPAMPEAAREESTAGAEAFVEHWADLVTYMLNTGDSGPLDAISEPGCGSCADTTEGITGLYDEGGRIESEGWSVKQLGFNQNSIASEPIARMVQGRERVWRSADDNKPDVNKRSELTISFDLRHERSGWRIAEYGVVE